MKLFTTKALKGDQTLTTTDLDGHVLHVGNIVKHANADLLNALVITQIYKNRNMQVRFLYDVEMRNGLIFYYGAASRLTPIDVIYLRDQA